MIDTLISLVTTHPLIALAVLGVLAIGYAISRTGYTGIPASSIYAVDGDTFSLEQRMTGSGTRPRLSVRPIGFDAPESSQAYGPEATAALRALIKEHGGLAMKERGIDQYGRVLAHVRLGVDGKGGDLARIMISHGHAHATDRSRIVRFFKSLPARLAGRGLWEGFILLRLFGWGITDPAIHRKVEKIEERIADASPARFGRVKPLYRKRRGNSGAVRSTIRLGHRLGGGFKGGGRRGGRV